MTDPEHFLSRWARKKRDAVSTPAAKPAVADQSNVPPGQATDGEPVDARPLAKVTEPAFDPADLPSIDSIGAQTDVRAFLKSGVPPDLTRAALRRAWTSDPAILNFKGLQENDWDFNDPNSMFGFGELDADFDVKRMLASVFGETPKEEAPAEVAPESLPPAGEVAAQTDDQGPDRAVLPAVTDEVGAGPENSSPTFDVRASEDEGIVQRTSDAASQRSESNPISARVRTHGGALPQ
jgi:hypothetical protein